MAAGTSKSKLVPPDCPVEPGDVIDAKYRVGEVIAVGGMGIVVQAEHMQLGQEVAIKVLLPTELAQEPHAAARFLREARAAARIRSDHVVRIYDVDTLANGLPYMVMERLYGSDLRALLRSQGPLPIADVVDYVAHACDAVGEAHRMGIVHRDLKPSNLFLVSRADGSTLVKVLDFGISKAVAQTALEGTLTTSRTLIGSPLYMSPEQIRDPKSVDARSDIWSCGVIMHQLLTGKQAFSADSLPGVCAAIAADPPASTRELRPDVPEELEQVIQKCLEKNPDDRYQNVEELCAALAPFGRFTAFATGSRQAQPVSSPRWIPPSAPSELPSGSHRMAVEPPLSIPPLAATRNEATRSRLGRPRVLVPIAAALAVALVVALFFALRPGAAPPASNAEAATPPKPVDPAPAVTQQENRGNLAAVQEPPASSSAPPAPAPTPNKPTRVAPRPKQTATATPPNPGSGTDIRLER